MAAPGLLAWLFGRPSPATIHVRVATDGPLPSCAQVGLTLTATAYGALPPIDGVSLQVGDRILVKNELDPSRNGVYIITSLGGTTSYWVLTRAPEMRVSAQLVAGMLVVVDDGSQRGTWVLGGSGPYVLGVSPLLWLREADSPGLLARITSLIQLLPPGKLWRLEPDNYLYKLLAGFALELERVKARYTQLRAELDPRTASETLADWERSLSLPDAVVPVLPTDTANRRTVILQKWVALGGQSYQFFTDFCLLCGYPLVSLTPGGNILRAGFRCGDRVYGQAWYYTVVITVGPANPGALSPVQLEAALRAALHAHLGLIVVHT